MPDVIPPFPDAVAQLNELLGRLGYSNVELLWVAREEFYGVRFGWYYLSPSIPVDTEEKLAEYYERSRKKGMVSVNALFYLPRTVGCSVWFPETVDEEVQGWSTGLRVSVATPIPIAAPVTSGISWWFHRSWSNYGNFQRQFHNAVSRKRLT